MVLQMAPDALGVIGLPCISYIFMNSFTHGRTSDKPYGNESTREYVKLANVKLDDRLGVGWWQVSTQVGPQKMDPTKSTKCSIDPIKVFGVYYNILGTMRPNPSEESQSCSGQSNRLASLGHKLLVEVARL